MPNTASAKKRVRQTESRTLRNKGRRSAMRTAIRKFDEAVAAGDKAQAEAMFLSAQRLIDKAAKHNLLHANNAGNQKAKLARRLRAM